MTLASVVRVLWHRASAGAAAPSVQIVVGTAVIALALVAMPAAWRYSRHLVTITHEASHGLVALASGRRVRGIRLHADTSGLTLSQGRAAGTGVVLTAAAGYIGPGLLGLGGAAILADGHPVAMLWLALVLLALMLVHIRNWFGLWSILVAATIVFITSWWASVAVQTAFAYTVTWFLLLAAPRPVVELQNSRRHGRAADSDADMLARLTGVTGLAWVAGFLLISVATLLIGASWLIGAARH